jgi:hypothetical protein
MTPLNYAMEVTFECSPADTKVAVSASIDCYVVTPYCPGHDLCPFILLLAFEYFLDCFEDQGVDSLNCHVGLWVVYRCKGDLCPNLMAEILEHGAIKVLGIINVDLLGISIEIDDVLPEEFLDGGGGCVHHRLCFNPFGEVFHCNDGEGVVSLCWCKLAHDVYAPPL